MSPLWILLAGLATVIGSILVFRLHAFLSLVLGAFVVGLLTPPGTVLDFELRSKAQAVSRLDRNLVAIPAPKKLQLQPRFVLAGEDGPVELESVDPAELTADQRADFDNHVFVRATGESTIPEDELVLLAADYSVASNAADKSIFGRLTFGLGTTCGKIGLLIAFASVIGYCLQASGAAERIVTSMLKITGERGAPLGFMLSGFLLGIPVFFDTVFYLMIPLGQALHRKTGKSYLMYVLSIVAGGTMAHSLVPPTPGPLFVADALGVDLGSMMIGGTLVGLATLLVAYVWTLILLRAGAELSLPEDIELPEINTGRKLPGIFASLLPIVLPVILIALPLTLKATGVTLGSSVDAGLKTLGDKNIALALAAMIALAMAMIYREENQQSLSKSIEKALSSAGIIILITAAGGAFGGMLRSSGLSLAGLVADDASPMMLVTLAFVATTVIRTAQGSATVAMMTAVGIFGPLVADGNFGFSPLYLALAIGAGSKPISWMNDSGFWVITRMSGMTEAQGLKYVTPMTTLMGLAALALLLAGVRFWPMAF